MRTRQEGWIRRCVDASRGPLNHHAVVHLQEVEVPVSTFFVSSALQNLPVLAPSLSLRVGPPTLVQPPSSS